MPVKSRLPKGRIIDDFKRQQLIEGPDLQLAGVGYFAPYNASSMADCTDEQQAEIMEAMRADWQRIGSRIIADCENTTWAARMFDQVGGDYND